MSNTTQYEVLGEHYRKAPRRRTAFLKEKILSSDCHSFIGRIYDLSIVSYHFETYEEMARHPDCVYALNVNRVLSSLTRRVESLNHVANMLWLDNKFVQQPSLPVTRYEWLNVCADTFLMRYVSLFDCALLLTNEVLEIKLRPQVCTIRNMKKEGAPPKLIAVLQDLDVAVTELRNERNERFHRGWEREHTTDDVSFKASTMHETRGMRITGFDQFGRALDQEKFFREGLVNLQRDFKKHTGHYVKKLDRLYNQLEPEFECRFSPKYRDKQTGFGHKLKTQLNPWKK